MCPPNKIVRELALEIVEAMKKSNRKKLREILADYSNMSYTIYFKSIAPKHFSDTKFLDSIPKEALEKSDKGLYLGVVVFVPAISCKTFQEARVYSSSLTGAADIRLRNKTMELNKNKCLNQATFMKSYGIDDKSIYYLCMYLKKHK